MLARLKMLWAGARDSLWFIPAIFTFLAVCLALGTLRLDRAFLEMMDGLDHWLLNGSAEGARSVLSTIAGTLITVTGVVFSVTIVALQLASTQFAPRILRNFMADRSNQIVLGVFISTFTYTLLVLRIVRSEVEGTAAFVPHLSVATAILLALISVGFLIYFIHHAARSIQVSVILARVTNDGLARIADLFPEDVGVSAVEAKQEPLVPLTPPELIPADNEGYLMAVDGNTLFELGEEREMLIRMAVPVGEFIVRGMALAEVWSNQPCDEAVCKKINKAFVLGKERTPEQDVEFCLVEVADVAVKALSPGINDPTTAIHCIDRLTQILMALAKRRPPDPLRTESGQVHFLARPSTFDSALRVAFDQIIHFGCSNPVVMNKMHQSLELLRLLIPPIRQPCLEPFQEAVDERLRALKTSEC